MSVTCELDTPAAGDWTTDDLDALPEDGRRRELIDGVLILSPSPTRFHQSLAGNLYYLLQQQCPREYDVTQAVEVRINRRRSLTPDILVVTAAAAERNPHYFAPHEVSLAIEIVSPSSATMDHVTKPALYAQAGVPLYWCVETKRDVIAHTYRLHGSDDIYEPSGTFSDVIKVSQPWDIRLPIADIMPRQPGK